MARYQVNAEISINGGPWEHYTSRYESASRLLPSAQKVIADLKHYQASLNGISEADIRIRQTKVTGLE